MFERVQSKMLKKMTIFLLPPKNWAWPLPWGGSPGDYPEGQGGREHADPKRLPVLIKSDSKLEQVLNL